VYFCLLQFLESNRVREAQNLPPLKLFTTNIDELDWFGWGDWLYFLTSIVSILEPLVEYFLIDTTMFAGAYYTLGAFVRTVSSIL
jgi:hypothetical protein